MQTTTTEGTNIGQLRSKMDRAKGRREVQERSVKELQRQLEKAKSDLSTTNAEIAELLGELKYKHGIKDVWID